MRLRAKKEMRVAIPTASMSDIAFLLIIFFMLTTVFRKEMGLKIELPEAKRTERILKSRNVANIYIDQNGRISVDDRFVTPEKVRFVFKVKVTENPSLIAQIKADKKTPYGYVADVLNALQEAQSFWVVFATEYEKG